MRRCQLEGLKSRTAHVYRRRVLRCQISDCLSCVRSGGCRPRFVGLGNGRVSARFRLTLSSAGGRMVGCLPGTTTRCDLASWPGFADAAEDADVTQTPESLEDTASKVGDSQVLVVKWGQRGCSASSAPSPKSQAAATRVHSLIHHPRRYPAPNSTCTPTSTLPPSPPSLFADTPTILLFNLYSVPDHN